MISRYPRTWATLCFMACLGVLIAVMVLWPPSAWILIGLGGLWVLYSDFRRDRRAQGLCRRCGSRMTSPDWCDRGHHRDGDV